MEYASNIDRLKGLSRLNGRLQIWSFPVPTKLALCTEYVLEKDVMRCFIRHVVSRSTKMQKLCMF
jgi:hypothetical protein